MNTISLAIHGGAGTLVKGMMTPEKELEYKTALQKALDVGYQLLEKGHTATEAVEASVKVLENCHLFNAGKVELTVKLLTQLIVKSKVQPFIFSLTTEHGVDVSK